MKKGEPMLNNSPRFSLVDKPPLSDKFPLSILFTDPNGRYLYSNAAYQKLCGWTSNELTGSHWSAVIHKPDRAKAIREWNTAVMSGTSFSSEMRLESSSGKVVWVRHNAAPVTDHVPCDGHIHTLEDITNYKSDELARKKAEEQLFVEKEQARITLDSIGDGVLSTDIDGRVTYMNAVAEALTGFNREEAIGLPLGDVFHVIDSESQERTADPAQRAILSNSIVCLQSHALLIDRNGTKLAIEDSAAPIHNRYGVIIGAVIVFHDLRFSRETTSRMAYLAYHDALTGLHNRNAFYEHFTQSLALAKRHQKQMGLLFIGLDNFKQINDLFGHASGDMVLTALAERLRSCVRSADSACRYGGDEFVILLSEIEQPNHAFTVAGKVRDAAAMPVLISGHAIELQLSIGVSVYPDDGVTADALLKKADEAMYRAKNLNRSSGGRNSKSVTTCQQASDQSSGGR